ncbi:MAG: aminotransferase class I/II-fold pyridoxal phosphate-dependent enzyme [Chloroflexia bacterium]
MSSYRPSAAKTLDPALADDVLRLHLNENPYGCSLLVRESLSIHDSLAHVPGPLPITLCRALSRYALRPESELYLVDSFDLLLERVLQTLLQGDRTLFAYTPTGTAFLSATRRIGVHPVEVQRSEDCRLLAGALPTDRFGERSVVYVGSPNDPTGDVAAASELVVMLNAGAVVVLDELYTEFSDKSPGLLGREFPGLVSLRSFAPWAGRGRTWQLSPRARSCRATRRPVRHGYWRPRGRARRSTTRPSRTA